MLANTIIMLTITVIRAATLPKKMPPMLNAISSDDIGHGQSLTGRSDPNATYTSSGHAYNTVAYRAYIGFLVTGIIFATLFPLIAISPILRRNFKEQHGLWKKGKIHKESQRREHHVEETYTRMVDITRPASTVLPQERA